jgi:hypothetical protein
MLCQYSHNFFGPTGANHVLKIISFKETNINLGNQNDMNNLYLTNTFKGKQDWIPATVLLTDISLSKFYFM